MEVIKNYLESMFANLPNTMEVQRAKSELYQMMEDKYTELISEGKPENEAIGIVISEFGNLDEIAETLGIDSVMRSYTASERTLVTLDEARAFVRDEAQHHFFIGLGVLLCILSVVGPILGDGTARHTDIGSAIGVALMFAMIAAAVVIFIYTSTRMRRWRFLRDFPCSIDYATAEYLYQEQQLEQTTRALYLTIGIVLCILSVVPVIIFDALGTNYFLTDAVAPSLLFVFVGIGVMLIIMAGGKEKAYRILLDVNDHGTVAGNYESTRQPHAKYDHPVVEAIMQVYWKIVLCVYLIWSFLSFDWFITWIIWPVAGIISSVIKSIYGIKGGDRS